MIVPAAQSSFSPRKSIIMMWHVYHSHIWRKRVADQGVSVAWQCFSTKLFSHSDIALHHIAILIILYNWFCSLYVQSCALVSIVSFIRPYRCSEWWDEQACSKYKALCPVIGHDALHIVHSSADRNLSSHGGERIQPNVAMFIPQIGTHIRAKRKREELSNVLAAMRKAAAKKD